mgnify:CR=1 FL=1
MRTNRECFQNPKRNFKAAKDPKRKKLKEPRLTSLKPIFERNGFFKWESWTKESMNPDPISRVTMKSGSSMESKVTWVSVCKVQIIGLLGF